MADRGGGGRGGVGMPWQQGRVTEADGGGVFSFNDAHNIIIYHSTCSHARGILASEGFYLAEKVYLARNRY